MKIFASESLKTWRPSRVGSTRQFLLAILALLVLVGLIVSGVRWSTGPEVVVYTALDAEFSRPIFAEFTRQTGIRVLPVFDTEATKTVGLANRIVAEGNRPRCDLFWNNEILNTLRLVDRGLVEAYIPPIAEEYPAMYRSSDGLWHGFAARARVIIVNTDLVAEADWPRSIHDLADEKWHSRTGIAKPLFGTTATHAACLFAHLGEQRAQEFFRKLKANGVKITAGNRQVAQDVASGRLAFGLTDTDDAIIEAEAGEPVEIIYPDQGPQQLGTLFIPNTLAVISGGPNPAAAKQLVDYLLTHEVEAALATGASAQIPLNPNVAAEVRVETPRTVKAMKVDFRAAADAWDKAAKFLSEEFATAL